MKNMMIQATLLGVSNILTGIVEVAAQKEKLCALKEVWSLDVSQFERLLVDSDTTWDKRPFPKNILRNRKQQLKGGAKQQFERKGCDKVKV
jgi:hypothetical protein